MQQNSAPEPALRLQQGLQALNMDAQTIARIQPILLAYIDLLCKWNNTYNLSSVRTPSEIVSRHILDCISIAPYLHGQRLLDVGSGAGLPGIPLAILYPEKNFVLLDSNGKKTRFLTQCVHELTLKNTEVVTARAEIYEPSMCFDSVLSRAFTSINEMLLITRKLCCKEGRFLAMKGAYPLTELEELSADFNVVSIPKIQVPGLSEERHLVILARETR